MAFTKTVGFTIQANTSNAKRELELLQRILKNVGKIGVSTSTQISRAVEASSKSNIAATRKLDKNTTDHFNKVKALLNDVVAAQKAGASAMVAANMRSTQAMAKNFKSLSDSIRSSMRNSNKSVQTNMRGMSIYSNNFITRMFGGLRTVERHGVMAFGKINSAARNFFEAGTHVNRILFNMKNLLVGVAGGSLFAGAINESIKFENAMIGLTSVAKSFKQDMDEAKQAAMDLASDGLISISGAALTLKQLIPDFGVKKAKELAVALKDIGAFNRQGTLSLERALVGATQGIKNRLSILVDNIGLTKNLSQIMKEQGFRMEDLDNAATKVDAKMALYKGLMKESAFATGDAAKLVSTMSGAMSKLSVQFSYVLKDLGDAIIKHTIFKDIVLATSMAMTDYRDKIDGVVKATVNFVTENQDMIKSVGSLIMKIAAVSAAVGALGAITLPLLSIGSTFRALADAAFLMGNSLYGVTTLLVTGFFSKMKSLNKVLGRTYGTMASIATHSGSKWAKAIGILTTKFTAFKTAVLASNLALAKTTLILGSIWYSITALKLALKVVTEIFNNLGWSDKVRIALENVTKTIKDWLVKSVKPITSLARTYLSIMMPGVGGAVFDKAISAIETFVNKSDKIIAKGIAGAKAGAKAAGDAALGYTLGGPLGQSFFDLETVIAGASESIKAFGEGNKLVVNDMVSQLRAAAGLLDNVVVSGLNGSDTESKIKSLKERIAELTAALTASKNNPVIKALFGDQGSKKIEDSLVKLKSFFNMSTEEFKKYLDLARKAQQATTNIVTPAKKEIDKFTKAFRTMYDSISDTIKESLSTAMVEGTAVDTGKIVKAVKKFYADQIADDVEKMIAKILFPEKAQTAQEKNTDSINKNVKATDNNTNALFTATKVMTQLPEQLALAMKAGMASGGSAYAATFTGIPNLPGQSNGTDKNVDKKLSEFDSMMANLKDPKSMATGIGQLATFGARLDMLNESIKNQTGVMGALSTYTQTSKLATAFGANSGMASTLGIVGAAVGFGLSKLAEHNERKRLRNYTINATRDLNNNINKAIADFSANIGSELSKTFGMFRDELTGTFQALQAGSEDAADALIKGFKTYEYGLNAPVYNWVWARDKANVTAQGLNMTTEGYNSFLEARLEQFKYFKDFASTMKDLVTEFQGIRSSFELNATRDPLEKVKQRSDAFTDALKDVITTEGFEQFEKIPNAANLLVETFNEVTSAVDGFASSISAIDSRLEELNILNRSFSMGIEDSIDSIRKIGFSNEQMLTENAQVINDLFSQLQSGSNNPQSMVSSLIRRFDETQAQFDQRRSEYMFEEQQSTAQRLAELISEQASLAVNTFGIGEQGQSFKNSATEALNRLDGIMSGLIQEQISQQQMYREQEMADLQTALEGLVPSDALTNIATLDQARMELEKATVASLNQLESLMADIGASLLTNNDMLAEVIWNATGNVTNLLELINVSVDDSLSRINNHMLVLAEMVDRTRPFSESILQQILENKNVMSSGQIFGALSADQVNSMLQQPVERQATGNSQVQSGNNVIINISGNLSKEEILNEIIPVIQQAVSRESSVGLA